jgi:hypothetical protein
MVSGVGKIDLVRAPEWVRSLEGKMHKAALKGLLSAAQRTVSVIQTEIIPREDRAPVDRGVYRAGWRARKLDDGALVYNNTPHAGIVEYGARAENIKVGKRMIDALTEWIIRKGLVGRASARDSAGRFSKSQQVNAARQIAWAIATSMKKKGIFGGKGLGILKKARLRIPELIEEEVRREIANMPR